MTGVSFHNTFRLILCFLSVSVSEPLSPTINEVHKEQEEEKCTVIFTRSGINWRSCLQLNSNIASIKKVVHLLVLYESAGGIKES